MKLRKLMALLCQVELRDHLLKDRPRFRMVLELQEHVRGRQRLLDMMHKLPSLHFRDCDDVDRVRHLDGRTSQQEDRDRRLHTAIPNDLRLEAVDEIVRPF